MTFIFTTGSKGGRQRRRIGWIRAILKPIRANWLKDIESGPERSADLLVAPVAETALRAKADSFPPLPVIVDRQARPERRAQARNAVDTSATIFFIKTGATLSGRIADLSLGGCRIRCEAQFPVGIYTRVETEFCLEGIPFRLGGVVQAIHDRFAIGIRFLDMSSRKREQVEQLMAELAEAGTKGTRDQGNEKRGA